jgi:hypothetical protein
MTPGRYEFTFRIDDDVYHAAVRSLLVGLALSENACF